MEDTVHSYRSAHQSHALARAIGVVGLCASLGAAAQVSAAAAAAAPISRIQGVITAAPGAALPTSFQLRRANGMMATVNIPSTTAIVLRYGGTATVATLTTGDHLVLNGAFETGNAVFDATRIQNVSVERVNASTHGIVSSVNAATNSLMVKVTGANYGSPLRGAVTVDIPATTAIPFPNGQTVTAGSIQAGDVIALQGLYDLQSHTLTTVTSVRGLRLVGSITRVLQPVSVSLHGSAYRRQHFVTVRIHATANAFVHVVLHFSGRQRAFSGRTGSRGYFTSRRFLAFGYWPRARLVQAVVVVRSGGQQRRAVTRAYIV